VQGTNVQKGQGLAWCHVAELVLRCNPEATVKFSDDPTVSHNMEIVLEEARRARLHHPRLARQGRLWGCVAG
jgi:hypothetical protein